MRENWVSRAGFILAAAGSAIGLGNIWRFPYVVGTNGGAAFVVIYLIIILVIGFPLMVSEISLGKMTQKNPVGAFKALAPDTPWWLVGAMGVLSGFVILSFYSVVAGWGLAYVLKTLQGVFTVSNTEEIFVGHITQGLQPVLWHFIFMVLTTIIITLGVVKGIGRSVKYLMPALFVLLLMLVVRALTLEGALEGVRFYLQPDFSEITFGSLLSATGQAFFSLSLGAGAMLTYGSYLKKGDDVVSSAVWVIFLDVGIALLAGLAIFPAVFALGFDPSVGAGLAFVTLPAVFAAMPLGNLFAFTFFLLLSIAALTSAISMLEIVVSWMVDEKGITRFKATIGIAILIFILGIPASLSIGAVDISIFGISFFDFLDLFQERFLLPIGALLTSIFVGYVLKGSKLRLEVNQDSKKLKLGAWFDVLIKYVVPTAIGGILIAGWISLFSS